MHSSRPAKTHPARIAKDDAAVDVGNILKFGYPEHRIQRSRARREASRAPAVDVSELPGYV